MKTSVFRGDLTELSKSPASIAKSNKQWVGTCLYQEECKLLLINCGAVIQKESLRSSSNKMSIVF